MIFSIRTERIFVAAICSLSAGAALADWTESTAGSSAAQAEQRLPDVAVTHATGETPVPFGAAMPFAAEGPVRGSVHENAQSAASGDDFRLWSQMSAEERAHIWPYLDDVAQAIHWREMTKKEKKALVKRLSDGDRDDLRRRFSIDPSEISQVKRSSHAMPQRPHRLNREELRLMRQQIIEVHLEYAQKHALHRKATDNADAAAPGAHSAEESTGR